MANPNNFPNIEGSELVSQSWTKLLERDASVKKQFAASEFPEVTADDVGTPCYREDEQKWYIFTGMGELDTPIWWCPFDEISAESIVFQPTEEFPTGTDTVAEALDFLSKKELPNAIVMPAESSEFVGDNVRAEFPLQKVTSNKNTVHVFFSGVKQSPSSYKLGEGGESVIFNEPPAYGETILIQENATILEYDLMPLEASFVADNETTFKMPIDIVDVRVVQVNVAGTVLQHNQYSVNGRDIILNEPVTGNVQITTIYKGQLNSPAPNTVNTVALQDEAVTGEKIADGTITESKLADASIGTMKIADNAITENKLPDGVITSNKIAEGSINLEHLAALVEQKLLGVERVASEMLQENSVNMAKLGTDVKSRLDEISAGVTSATENMQGVVKLASAEEILANTGGDKVVTSDTFNDAIDKIEKLGGGRSIGDIFYTSRMDKELNGAVECDGAAYNVNDYSGEITIGGLLSGGELPYISLEEYEEVITLNGSCRCFGWDGGDIFRVPTLSEVYIEANLAAGAGRYRAMVQLYTGAKEISITDYTNRIEEVTINVKEDVTNTVETAISDLDNAVASGKSEIEDAIQEGLAGIDTAFGGGGLEIGDIGIAPLGIDETQNKRRYLNGQVISQSQFESFTNWIKERANLYPNTVATEENWQAEVTNSKLGQCGKFVIDDTAGTIRLPKVVNINGLQDLALMGSIKAESLPNITGNFRTVEFSWIPTGAFQISDTRAESPAGGSTSSLDWINFNASRSSSTYQDKAPVQQEAIQYPYFIQVATGVEESVDVTREIELNNPFFLGMSQYFESEPKNASWLISNGSFHSGATYVSFYEWLLKIYNGTEIVEGVSVKSSADVYDDYDYVINIADMTFRLPLLNGSENLPSARYDNLTLEASGSKYTAPANGYFLVSKVTGVTTHTYLDLINETSSLMGVRSNSSDSSVTVSRISVFAKKGDIVRCSYNVTGETHEFKFIYARGNGSLYYYVGETIQDANLINAVGMFEDVADLKKTALRTDQITDCFIEVSQDLKLELNNGMLTLKAGSVLTDPLNGKQRTTTQDQTGTLTTNGQYVVFVDKATGALQLSSNYTVTRIGSGSTLPADGSTFSVFYNLTDRKIYRWNGSVWTEWSVAFPSGIITVSNNVISSIDRVFNGFGYIGIELYSLPNIKVFIPDGRNDDWTLKNKILITTEVSTLTANGDGVRYTTIANTGKLYRNYSELYYDDKRNIYTDASGSIKYGYALAIQYVIKDGVITEFNPKLPFRAVDRNDSSWVAGQAMPSNKYIDLTLGATGASYIAPTNGYFYVNKSSTAASQYIVVADSEGAFSNSVFSTGSHQCRIVSPALKGHKYQISYNLGGSTNVFRFVYCEGEI